MDFLNTLNKEDFVSEFPPAVEMEFEEEILVEEDDNDSVTSNSDSLPTVFMDPKTIKFTQERISPSFSRGPKSDGDQGSRRESKRNTSKKSYVDILKRPPGKSLEASLAELKNGLSSILDYPPIRVVFHKGDWYSLDNRRLWLFQKFGQQIPVIQVSADKEFFQKLEINGRNQEVRMDTKKIHTEMGSLESHILKWSVEQISNPRLLVNKVKWIPETFKSVDSYLQSFKMPLIEECRGKLQQSLEKISSLPCSPVKIQNFTNEKGQNGSLTELSLILVEDPLDWTASGIKVKPTDLILLSSIRPQEAKDFCRQGVVYTLGLVRGRKDEENDGNFCRFTATVYAPQESPEFNALEESLGKNKFKWFLTVLDCLATPLRIWSALETPSIRLEEESDDLIESNAEILEEVICDQESKDVKKEPTCESLSETFDELKFSPQIRQNIKQSLHFLKPSKLQGACLPKIGSIPKYHILAEGPKESGKSLCSLLAILSRLKEYIQIPQALCLCATKEHGIKLEALLVQLTSQTKISVTTIFSNEDVYQYFSQISSQIVIGIPGYVKRLISKRKISPHRITLVVFDDISSILETEGYYDDSINLLRSISNGKPRYQVLLLATTISDRTKKIVKKLTRQVFRVVVSSNGETRMEVVSTTDNSSSSTSAIASDFNQKVETIPNDDQIFDPPLSIYERSLSEMARLYCKSQRLNDSQILATSNIFKTLLYRNDDFGNNFGVGDEAGSSETTFWKKRIQLIQGPPGTGKTSTVATLLSIICSSGFRVLVSAPTNTAVSEVALRVLFFFDNFGPIQFGQYLEKEGFSEYGLQVCRTLRKGDIAMIGNEERIEIDGLLGEIFFGRNRNDRASRILYALNTLTGWGASARAAFSLLCSGIQEYDDHIAEFFTEIEGKKGEKTGNVKDSESGSKEPEKMSQKPSLLEFFRKRFKELVLQMNHGGHALCSDLPSFFLSDEDYENILKAIGAANAILELLNSTKVNSSHLKLWLSDQDSGNLFENVSFMEKGDSLHTIFQNWKRVLRSVLSSRPGYDIPGIPANATKSTITVKCLSHVSLLFSTVSSAGKSIVGNAGKFDLLLIDEAAQLVEAETIIGLQVNGIKQVVLVGDPKQLPATVFSQVAKDHAYDRSLFERLQKNGYRAILLGVQYRMNPSISRWPRMFFYNGNVENGPNVINLDYRRIYQEKFFGAYAFLNVSEGREKQDEEGRSRYNDVEATVVTHLVQRLRSECEKNKLPKTDVGVITPYTSQVSKIERQLLRYTSSGSFEERKPFFGVEVKSVDGFQGREKDIIIFSTVRANAERDVGFLSDARRLNVAITRGRHIVWIVGHSPTLCAGDITWRSLIEDARKRGCFFEAAKDSGVAKAIMMCKTELGEIQDLLKPGSFLLDNQLWKAVFSRDFQESFRRVKSKERKLLVIHAIRRLMEGRRSSVSTSPQQKLNELMMKIINIQTVETLKLVWTIDVDRGNGCIQIIKVWDLVEQSGVAAWVSRLQKGLNTYSDGYLKRCAFKKIDKTGKLTVPEKFAEDPSFVWHVVFDKFAPIETSQDENERQSGLEKAPVDESVLLMKFYPISSGVARNLLALPEGSELDLPFMVNEQESTIINYQKSVFILGRSGTGKTTIITHRLLDKERRFWLASRGDAGLENTKISVDEAENKIPKLRQAIITASPRLCAAIKHHINKARRSLLAADYGIENLQMGNSDSNDELLLDDEAEEKLFGNLPEIFSEVPSEAFPLVLTFKKILHMLDKELSDPFLVVERKKTSLRDVQLVDERELREEGDDDDSGDWNSAHGDFDDFNDNDGDTDYSDDEIEIGYLPKEQNKFLRKGQTDIEEKNRKKNRSTEVDYERFVSHYWPHMDLGVRRRLDASLVFKEIVSHIKGTVEVLRSRRGYLEESDYVALAKSRSSTFGESQREQIYQVFRRYERMKRDFGEYDIADFVFHVYRALNREGYLGPKLSFVYVDEVQDLTQVQIAVLKFVCNNVEEGFVFAGDTAQTIARGVDFRFQDVRRLFYEEFLGKRGQLETLSHESGKSSNNIKGSMSIAAKDDGFVDKFSVPVSQTSAKVPDMHQLSQNFRTHNGIVKLADSVVNLLLHFFPYAVDRLDPECSLIDGDLPVFLEAQENCDLVTELFGKVSGVVGGGGCEFGAEQVILVRDAESRQKMMERVGNRGLVLSVLECKGLEFQDVLVYNFFTDSNLKEKWRLVYNFLKMENIDEGGNSRWAHPQFDERRHNLLCSELKQLYVVLTRARQRLWIYDEDENSSRPMKDLWSHLNLLTVAPLDQKMIASMHKEDSPEAWHRRGVEMFNVQNYEQAQMSFERAGDMMNAHLSKAAGLQQAAGRQHGVNFSEASKKYIAAGDLFLQCSKEKEAAVCFYKGGDKKRAGEVYRDRCKPPVFEKAGQCFEEENLFQESALCYSEAKLFEEALSVCYKGRRLDSGLDLVLQWEKDLEFEEKETHCQETNHGLKINPEKGLTKGERKNKLQTLKAEYFLKCANYHYRKKDVKSMVKFVKNFPSVEKQRVYLLRRDFFEELVSLEKDLGNFERAADMLKKKGDLLEAGEMYLQAKKFKEAMETMSIYARSKLFWSNDAWGWPIQWEGIEALDKVKEIVETAKREGVELPRLLSTEYFVLSELVSCVEDLEVIEKLRDSANEGEPWLQLLVARQALDLGIKKWRENGKLGQDNNKNVPKQSSNRLPNRGTNIGNESMSSQTDPLVNISMNEISVEKLMELWDSWSNNVVIFLRSLQKIYKSRDTPQDQELFERYFNFFGCIPQEDPEKCIIYSLDAKWVLDSRLEPLPRQGRQGELEKKMIAFHMGKFFATWLALSGKECIDVFVPTVNSMCEILDSRIFFRIGQGDTFNRGQTVLAILKICHQIEENVSSKGVTGGGSSAIFADYQSRKWVEEVEKEYEKKLIELVIPSTANMENLQEVLRMREEQGVSEILERLVEKKIGNVTDLLTFEEMGEISLLLPFLSKSRLTKEVSEIDKKLPQLITEARRRLLNASLWEFSVRNVETETKTPQSCPIASSVGLNCHALKTIYYDIDFRTVRGYTSPFTFTALLEKTTINCLSCVSLLQTLVLPLNLALDTVAHPNQEALLTSLLRNGCPNAYIYQFQQFLFKIAEMISTIILDPDGLDAWFVRSKLDKSKLKPRVFLRLIILLITININTSANYIRQTQELTINCFKSLFYGIKPLVPGFLPAQFIDPIWKLVSSNYLPSPADLGVAFKFSLFGLGDKLVVLKRLGIRGEWLPYWAKQLYYVVIEKRNEKGERFFSLDRLRQKKVSVEEKKMLKTDSDKVSKSKENDHVDNLDGNEGDTNKQLTEKLSEEIEESGEGEMLESGEGERLSEGVDSMDVGGGGNERESVVGRGEEGDTKGAEVNASNQPPEVTESGTISEMKPSLVFSVDGVQISLKVVERLRNLMMEARERLQQELSPTERFIRTAKEVLRESHSSPSYIETFTEKACPLQAEAAIFLEKLGQATTLLKNGEGGSTAMDEELLDDALDLQDLLRTNLSILDPRHEHHRFSDFEWLETKAIKEVQNLLQMGKEKMEVSFENLIKASLKSTNRVEKTKGTEKSKSSEKGKLSIPEASMDQKKKSGKQKKKKGK